MQMMLVAVLVDTLHPALEDREIAFNRVRSDQAAILGLTGIFLGGMVDGFMAGEPRPDVPISAQFVGHQCALGVGVGEDGGAQFASLYVVHLDRTRPTATFDKGEDRNAIAVAALFLPAAFIVELPS